MRLSAFLDHVRTRGGQVLVTGRGARVTCFAHDDDHPSVDVCEGRDGRLLVVCRAGCSTYDVVRALGLHMSDLFATPPPPRAPRAPATSPLAAARDLAETLASRQRWTRPDVEALNFAADALKYADRERLTMRDEAHPDWARLAALARVTRLAEALWAEALG